MRITGRWLVLAWLALFPASIPAAHADDLVLDSSSGYTLQGEINGRQLRLLVDPAASGYIILNPRAASQAGIGWARGFSRTRVGPYELRGRSSTSRISIGGRVFFDRVTFYDRPFVEGADGRISPELLPYENVTFRLAAARPGETVRTIPLTFTKPGGLFHRLPIANNEIAVGFSLRSRLTTATASAAALLAAQYGSRWSGLPRSYPVAFGIERSVRLMELERPLSLHGFDLSSFLVRTADNRGNYHLPVDARPSDPSEVVVTGMFASNQAPLMTLTIGQDRLASCSSMTFQKSTRQLLLRCS